MELNYYFPTVIGRFYKPKLRDKMLPLVKEVLKDEKILTYEWGYKNTYNVKGLEELPEFKDFSNFLKQIGYDYLNKLGYSSRGELVPNIFASGMESGDSHPRHAHPGSELSGVFYLDCPEGSSDILFHDSRIIHDCRSTLRKEKENIITSNSINISPQNGLFLIWESWINHEVLLNKSNSPRTTLVFNLGL